MRIKSFSVGPMRQQQAFGFYQKCVVKVLDLENIPFLKPFVENFTSAVSRFDLALKPIRKNLLTEEITKADERRDNAWRALKTAVQLKLLHFAPKEVGIGKKADLILSTYGDPTRLPYTEESGVIHNILVDFDTAFGPDIDNTGLSEWVDELRMANNAFNKLRHDRHQTQQYLQAGKSKEERRKTDDSYRDLVEKINAYVIMNGATNELQSAISGINLMIDAENALLKGRRTRSANKANTPEEEDQPGE